MMSSPDSRSSRSSSPAPSVTSFLSNSLPASVFRTLQRISSDIQGLGEDGHNHQQQQQQQQQLHHSQYERSAPTSIPDTYTPRRRPSPYAPPPLAPIKLAGVTPTSKSSLLLNPAIAEEIRALMPARLQLHETWTLMYSLEHHGVSLSTLYSKLGKGAFVFVVKDTADGTFGAFANESIKPSAGRYYGTGECFLWKASFLNSSASSISSRQQQQHLAAKQSTDNIRFKAFPYSGVNDYMILCDHNFISFGGGDGHYGLWVDDSFDVGVSSSCPTFGNEPLSDEGEKFDILGIEVWRIGPAV